MVGHNIKSDLRTLGWYPDSGVYCTLMLSWLVNENGKHGLKAVSEQLLGRKLEDPIKMEGRATYFKQGNRYVPIAEADQSLVELYCQEDTRATKDLLPLYWGMLTDKQKDWYLTKEQPFDRILWEMESRGIRLNLDEVARESYTMRQELQQLTQDIYSDVGYEFNIGSGKQLGNVLFKSEWTTKERQVVGQFKGGKTPGADKYGWVPVERKGLGLTAPKRKTEGGQDKTDEECLIEYTHLHPVVQRVLDYKEKDKIVGTYLSSFTERTDPDSRLRGSFRATGTVTGRLSSSDPNMQNIPSRGDLGKRMRNLFIPEPGKVLVVADLDQIEYRLLASFSEDPGLVEAFLTGADVHQKTAELLGHTVRDVGKTLNYASAYGAGAAKLAATLTKAGVPTTAKQVKPLLQKYHEALPGVADWKERLLKFARKHNAVFTIGGRQRHLVGMNSPTWELKARAERQAVNSVIQGSAGDLVKFWMLEVAHLPLLLQVHDELVAEVPEDQAEYAVNELREGLKRVEKLVNLKVPITAEPKVVANWGEAK